MSLKIGHRVNQPFLEVLLDCPITDSQVRLVTQRKEQEALHQSDGKLETIILFFLNHLIYFNYSDYFGCAPLANCVPSRCFPEVCQRCSFDV